MNLVAQVQQLQVRTFTVMSARHHTITTTIREHSDVGHGTASHHGVGDQFVSSENAAQFNAVGQAAQYNFSGVSSSMNMFIGEFRSYWIFYSGAVQPPGLERFPYTVISHIAQHRSSSQK